MYQYIARFSKVCTCTNKTTWI